MKTRCALLLVLFSSLASLASAGELSLGITFNNLGGGAGEVKVTDSSGAVLVVCSQLTQDACKISVRAGTTVALTATPLGGGVFSGWSVGGGSASACLGANTNNPVCKIEVTQDSSVKAAFSPSSRRKTMAVIFAGSGTANVIARFVGGQTTMNCPNLPTTCKKELFQGSLFELVPIIQSGGTVFAGWSNASGATTVCVQNPTSVCKFVFSGDSAVTATFKQN